MSFVGFNEAANQSLLAGYTKSAGVNNLKFDQKYVDAWSSFKYDTFSTTPNTPAFGGNVLNSNPISTNTSAWTFITPPQSVSYSVDSDVQRVEIFGTNTPPVVASSSGMRDLTLSEALMEGFTIGKAIQKHLNDLEKLMDVTVNSESGFVSVPVYKVFAGEKDYGMYVIEKIEVDEQLRDNQGNATRAIVGVSLKEVPEYQVGTGIDQAGSSTGGQAQDPSKYTNQSAQQDAKTKAANAQKTATAKVGNNPVTNASPAAQVSQTSAASQAKQPVAAIQGSLPGSQADVSAVNFRG